MLWSSKSKDFTTCEISQPLIFGGQSLGPPSDQPIVLLSVTVWLLRTVKCENKKSNFRKF